MAAMSLAATTRAAITMTATTTSRVGISGIGDAIMHGTATVGTRAGTTAVITGTVVMAGATATATDGAGMDTTGGTMGAGIIAVITDDDA